MSIERKAFDDVDRLIAMCEQGGIKRGLKTTTLGVVDRYPINLLQTEKKDHRVSLLIIGSIHGDEPSGSWGIAQFIDTANRWLFDYANISLLPIVNPTGLRNRTRENMWGDDPNRNLIGVVDPSYEGKILLDNLSLLTKCARDGFLSLHEDIDRNDFYLYSYNNNDDVRYSRIAKRLRDYAKEFFPIADDRTIERASAKDGIIVNYQDQSFENLLFTTGEVNGVAIEIPGKQEILMRIQAAAQMIEQFIILSPHRRDNITFKQYLIAK